MHLTSWVFPKGHRIRLAISNALWPMMLPTPYSMTTSLQLGSNGSRLTLPVVPVKGATVPAFPTPQPAEERTDIRSVGYPWPGDWTLERDEANHKATVRWKGKAETNFPWGKEVDYESLTYHVDDAHPELSPVEGEAESIFTLKGRELRWRGHLSLITDQKNFYYKYTRELLKDGADVETEDVGRNDFERPPINKISVGRTLLSAPHNQPQLLLVNFPIFHHELNMLQHSDVLQRIASNCNHVGVLARLDIADDIGMSQQIRR